MNNPRTRHAARRRGCTTAMAGVLLGASASAQDVFTYQGYLSENGGPAEDVVDINAAVFDAESDGNQLLFTILDDVQLAGGVFTIELPVASPLDGSAVFTGGPRWLRLGVRPGNAAAFDPFTFLPRERVNPTPYAVRSLSQGFTRQSPAGPGTASIEAGDGDDRVLINRSSPLSGAEFFGLTAPADFTGFAGMYIDATPAAPGELTKPFYGYASGGAIRGWTEMSDAFRVIMNNTESLVITPFGELSTPASVASPLLIGDTVSADTLIANTSVSTPRIVADRVVAGEVELSPPVTRFVSHSAVEARIVPAGSNGTEGGFIVIDDVSSFGPNGRLATGRGDTSDQLFIALDLPHGAAVTGVTAWFQEIAGPDSYFLGRVQRRRVSDGFPAGEITRLVADQLEFDPYSVSAVVNPSAKPEAVVDRSLYTYELLIDPVLFDNTGPGIWFRIARESGFLGVVVSFTVDGL